MEAKHSLQLGTSIFTFPTIVQRCDFLYKLYPSFPASSVAVNSFMSEFADSFIIVKTVATSVD